MDISDLPKALNRWCNYAVWIGTLDELEIREAFLLREELRQALDSEEDEFSADDDTALRAADDLFDREADRVVPLLALGGWIQTQPADSYAVAYCLRHSASLPLPRGEGAGG